MNTRHRLCRTRTGGASLTGTLLPDNRIDRGLPGLQRREALLDRYRLWLACPHRPNEIGDVPVGRPPEIPALVVEEVAVPDQRERLRALLLLMSLDQIRPRGVLEP